MDDFEFPVGFSPNRGDPDRKPFIKPERKMTPKEKHLRQLIKNAGFPEASEELNLRECELSIDELVKIWESYISTGRIRLDFN